MTKKKSNIKIIIHDPGQECLAKISTSMVIKLRKIPDYNACCGKKYQVADRSRHKQNCIPVILIDIEGLWIVPCAGPGRDKTFCTTTIIL